jgi:hypothetical protein
VTLDQLRIVTPDSTRAGAIRSRCHAAMARRVRAQARRRSIRASWTLAFVIAIPVVFLVAVVRDLLVVRLWR